MGGEVKSGGGGGAGRLVYIWEGGAERSPERSWTKQELRNSLSWKSSHLLIFFSQLPCLCPNLLLQSQGPLQGCVPPHSTQGTCQPLQLTPASAPLSRLGESLILLPPPALSPRRRLSHSTFLLGKQQQKINKGSEEEVLARRALVGVAPDRDTLKSDQKKVG